MLAAAHELPPAPPGAPARVDRGTTATLALTGDSTAALVCDFGLRPRLWVVPRLPEVRVVAVCAGGELEMFNFIMPTLYHWIRVRVREGSGRRERVEKVYAFAEGAGRGEEWWTTYRYQLEAFVEKVRGRAPQTWVEREDSVQNMRWIEEIYKKVGATFWFYGAVESDCFTFRRDWAVGRNLHLCLSEQCQ